MLKRGGVEGDERACLKKHEILLYHKDTMHFKFLYKRSASFCIVGHLDTFFIFILFFHWSLDLPSTFTNMGAQHIFYSSFFSTLLYYHFFFSAQNDLFPPSRPLYIIRSFFTFILEFVLVHTNEVLSEGSITRGEPMPYVGSDAQRGS